MKALVITLILISRVSWGTVTVGTTECPVEFEGRVKELIKKDAPVTILATQTVVFENLRTNKGDVGDQVSVDVLENGLQTIESGKDYRVQLRNGRLCWIESI